MLILHRKPGESILIGDTIKINVVELSSGGVRLAIDAPRDIAVMREELAAAAEVNEASVLPPISSIQSLQAVLGHRKKDEKA